MKLDTSKITDGVAIHCPKKEYVRPLFEAMGWENVNKGEAHWNDYKEWLCFRIDGTGWGYSNRMWHQNRGYTIIPFTDLIIEECNLIKALHGVGVGDWLQEGVEFSFNGRRCRADDDWILFWNKDMKRWQREKNSAIVAMIYNPEKIKPLPKWTPEEQEMAKKDMACSAGFKYVSKDGASITMLWTDQPEIGYGNGEFVRGGHSVWSRYDYPSLLPGECVSLIEIAGGGE